jgi:hypothetical protein
VLAKARRARNKRAREARFVEGVDEACRMSEALFIEGTGGA